MLQNNKLDDRKLGNFSCGLQRKLSKTHVIQHPCYKSMESFVQNLLINYGIQSDLKYKISFLFLIKNTDLNNQVQLVYEYCEIISENFLV